jgi:hypothetical protein
LLDAQANELNAQLSGIPAGSDLWQAPEKQWLPVPRQIDWGAAPLKGRQAAWGTTLSA